MRCAGELARTRQYPPLVLHTLLAMVNRNAYQTRLEDSAARMVVRICCIAQQRDFTTREYSILVVFKLLMYFLLAKRCQ